MASKRKPEAQARLKENYANLRAAGLTPLEASRLRSATQAKVNAAIATGGRTTPISERNQEQGAGRKTKLPEPNIGPYGSHKGRIKAGDYRDLVKVSEGGNDYFIYRGRYAYTFTYVTVTKDGVQDRKYYSIVSDYKRTKSDLIEEVYEAVQKGNGSYEAKVSKSSIHLLEALHNPDFD